MKLLPILFAIVVLMSGCVVTPGNVAQISNSLQAKYASIDDYSFTLVEENKLTGAVERADVFVKKPNFRKYVYEDNSVWLLDYSREELDFYSALIKWMDRSTMTAETAVLNGKEVYKVIMEEDRTTDIFYFDKETALPLKIEYYMAEDRCEVLNEFFAEQEMSELEDCIYRVELVENLQINTGLTEADFDLADGQTEHKGEGNIRHETARPISEAPFTVKLPPKLPSGFYVEPYVEREHSKSGLRVYQNELFDLKFWIADAKFYVAENLEDIDDLSTGYITESNSPILFFYKSDYYPVAERKNVLVNGEPAEVVRYEHCEKKLFWRDDNLYYEISYPANTGDNTCTFVWSDEEVIAIAESFVPYTDVDVPWLTKSGVYELCVKRAMGYAPGGGEFRYPNIADSVQKCGTMYKAITPAYETGVKTGDWYWFLEEDGTFLHQCNCNAEWTDQECLDQYGVDASYCVELLTMSCESKNLCE